MISRSNLHNNNWVNLLLIIIFGLMLSIVCVRLIEWATMCVRERITHHNPSSNLKGIFVNTTEVHRRIRKHTEKKTIWTVSQHYVCVLTIDIGRVGY